MREVVKAAGFRTLHRTHFNALLLPAIVGVRALNRLRGKRGGDDDRVPSAPVNRMLAGLFGWERHAAVRGLWPLGVSIGMMAEPAEGGSTR